MAKTPATQLNNFIEKLAHYLQDNRPHFVKNYGVTCSNVPGEGDESTIRFVCNFTISNSELRKLETAGLIGEREV